MDRFPYLEVTLIPPPLRRSIEGKDFPTKHAYSPAPKRTRSPPLLFTDKGNQGSSPQDENEREMQAKAKRLARFKMELNQPLESMDVMRRGRADAEGDLDGSARPEHEEPKSTTVITGSCPDMCPVSEREERERKGDLDQYERLDGDRNRTNKSLAVKKYNRTAEREESLIRPMPVLRKTIDYLLYLLDQPYDDKFLGLYNFLWDRMRAIRMDLRMQHLFNLDAIAMLEQMIRLHIIAMHELCEIAKGEGFSEGFDAHLNIEQMNKTSVELFQLYDDHRKKGINVPTEKEFRGYYALLKLDKHPGYKVEPAELSLDLSKMTPEIRQTQEVLFARDVARACRTGNFIAFFRLARKATYLQACLMHAHFAKLRTQALASLHSALQVNQGIPVAHVANWLAMEEEDIESLLEYHGFFIKEFDEPYMVKDGQFLHSENDYPLKCSELVHMKKSKMISEDVSTSHSAESLFPVVKEDQLTNGGQQPKPVQTVGLSLESPAEPIDEEMDDNEPVPSPRSSPLVIPLKTSNFGRQSEKDQMAQAGALSWDFSPTVCFPNSPQARASSSGKSPFISVFSSSLEKAAQSNIEANPVQAMTVTTVDQEKFESPKSVFTSENSVSKMIIEDRIEDEDHTDSHWYDKEVAEAKLRLIFRLWRRHSFRRRELREQRQLAAVVALNSLSLGLPIRQHIDQPSTSTKLNIDHIAVEIYERNERSWSSLNVSEVIAGAMSKRNLAPGCFCWKMSMGSQIQGSDSIARLWLISKLMPMERHGDFNLITSSPDLSIWKKWVPSKNGGSSSCYLSVIKEAKFDNFGDTVLGSSGILFLIPENFSLEVERIRLYNFISSLPSGSHLPLLILVGAYEENSNSSKLMADQLGLNEIDRSRVSSYLVNFLKRNEKFNEFDGFFSDEELRKGLNWLACHSPLPPDVRRVKMRDLIGTHLGSALRVLDDMGAYEVGPNHCISAFNKALDQALGQVVDAANANRSSWPCPEIDLIDKTSYEYEMVISHLPEIGWSSPDRIEQVVSALEGTQLPAFEGELSFLYEGSNSKKEIENQRQQLENCLVNYLALSSKMMGLSLATNEARVMIQRSARLELHNSTYYIIPMWVPIFHRIFNWRMMSLSSGTISTAYIGEHDVDVSFLGMEKLALEDKFSPYNLNSPSLDEMIDVCTEVKGFRPPALLVSDDSKAVKFTTLDNWSERKLGFDEDDNSEEMNNCKSIDIRSEKSMAESDKLSKLLEKCNKSQDKIEKQLSIFF